MKNPMDVLRSWRDGAAVRVPERRRMNYFGQLYCPDCQKQGRDNVLRSAAANGALSCSGGHRFDR